MFVANGDMALIKRIKDLSLTIKELDQDYTVSVTNINHYSVLIDDHNAGYLMCHAFRRAGS